MSKIKFAWGNPITEEIYDMRRGCKAERIIEPCRKNHLLVVIIQGDYATCKKQFHAIYDSIHTYEDNALIVSDADWGISESYDEEAHVYTNRIAIEKHYDSLAAQKQSILDFSRQQARILSHTRIKNTSPARAIA